MMNRVRIQVSVKDLHTVENLGDKSRMRRKQETATKLSCPTIQWKKGTIVTMSSRCKVKHVSLRQHCETVLNNSSCRILSQFTEVFYCNPDCET